MLGLSSWRSSALIGLLTLLLLDRSFSQESELLTKEIMDLVVIAMNASGMVYSLEEGSAFVDAHPIPVTTTSCIGKVCQEQVTLRGGLYTSGTFVPTMQYDGMR